MKLPKGWKGVLTPSKEKLNKILRKKLWMSRLILSDPNSKPLDLLNEVQGQYFDPSANWQLEQTMREAVIEGRNGRGQSFYTAIPVTISRCWSYVAGNKSADYGLDEFPLIPKGFLKRIITSDNPTWQAPSRDAYWTSPRIGYLLYFLMYEYPTLLYNNQEAGIDKSEVLARRKYALLFTDGGKPERDPEFVKRAHQKALLISKLYEGDVLSGR
jgi:hypothetical protein